MNSSTAENFTFAEGRSGCEITGGIEHARQERATEAAEEGVAAGEGDAVTVDRPQHRQHAEGDEHLHRHRQHVLRTHHAAVEQCESWHGHHQHQQSADQHPRDVPLVVCRRRGRSSSGLLRRGRLHADHQDQCREPQQREC
jgi:hypothetical protein